MDYSKEDVIDSYLLEDELMKLPKVLVILMELVASMPISILNFVAIHTLGKNRMTKWILVDTKWKKCLKRSLTLNHCYIMQTIRTKSLLSHVGLNRDVAATMQDVVLEVTYMQAHLKERKYHIEKRKSPVFL